MSINNKMIKLIEDYQNNKPPSTVGKCIHYPTCSAYAKECYQKFNFFKATFLSSKRILFCNPLNKKVYDPVPLTKKEKKEDKRLQLEADKIKDILLMHYQLYPLMQLNDYLQLIYQNSFGPYHLHELNYDDVKNYLDNELDLVTSDIEYIEDIGNNYIRYYLYQGLDKDKLIKDFIDSSNNIMNEENIRIFYRKVNVLTKLIKQKKIKIYNEDNKIIKPKLLTKDIQIYLQDGFKPLHHSNIYNINYKPHYRVIKKSITF